MEQEAVLPEEPAEQAPEPPAPEPPAPEPEPKRGRGRPPGSKNKPKINVVPLPAAPAPPPPPEVSGEEADTEETPAAKPKAKAQPKVVTKVVRMPELPPPAMTAHQTFKMAMEALSHMAQADQQSRQDKFDALVARMVR